MKWVKGEKGFLIIDAIIGMLVLSIALAGVIIAYTQVSKDMVLTRNYNRAVIVARQAVEESRQYNGHGTAPDGVSFTADQIKQGIKEVTKRINNDNSTSTDNKMFKLDYRFDGIKVVDAKFVDSSLTDDTISKLVPVKFTVSWSEPGLKKRGDTVIPTRTIEVIDYYYTN